MQSGGQNRPRPELKRMPRHPMWSLRLRPWLGRRARGADDALTERLGGPARRTVVLYLGLVLALNSADGSAVGAIAGQLQPALGIGPAELGLLVTASTLVGALAAIPMGVLVDRTRRVDLLAVSVVLWGVAEALSAFAPSFRMLLLTRLLLGAVTATAVPAVASLTGDFFPAGERGRIYGYIITGEVVGAGIGIGVSSLVSAAFGWRAAFFVLAIPSLVLAWMLWRRLPEPARGGQSRLEPGATHIISASSVSESGPPADGADEQPRTDDAVLQGVRRRGVEPNEGNVVAADPTALSFWQVVRYVLRVRTNVNIIIASSLGYLLLAGMRTFAWSFARGHFGVGQAMATLLLGLVGVGALLGLLTAGRLADWLIGRGRVDARIVVAGVAFILSAALFVPALLTTRFIIALPLLMLAVAALSARNPPLDAAQLDVVPAQLWGRAQGVRTALRNTLEALGPLAFGVIAGLFIPGSVQVEGSAGAEIIPGRDARAAGRVLRVSGGARRGRNPAAGDPASLPCGRSLRRGVGATRPRGTAGCVSPRAA